MPAVSVCLSPLLANIHDFTGKIAVVVDVLRATTTIITAFEYGVKSILPVDSIEVCRDFQLQGYIGAAEREGKKVKGFELGNSPFDYFNPCCAGKKIVFTTTNGTRTISTIKKADRIIFGAFVNLDVVAGFLNSLKKNIVIVCAGWEGEVNLEDTLFAGTLISKLRSSFLREGDAAVLAYNLYKQSGEDLLGFLEESTHVNRLKKLGLQKDINFCLELNKYEIIPELIDGEIIPVENIRNAII
jgi:2-phosphosulfolactate phosphatase